MDLSHFINKFVTNAKSFQQMVPNAHPFLCTLTILPTIAKTRFSIRRNVSTRGGIFSTKCTARSCDLRQNSTTFGFSIYFFGDPCYTVNI